MIKSALIGFFAACGLFVLISSYEVPLSSAETVRTVRSGECISGVLKRNEKQHFSLALKRDAVILVDCENEDKKSDFEPDLLLIHGSGKKYEAIHPAEYNGSRVTRRARIVGLVNGGGCRIVVSERFGREGGYRLTVNTSPEQSLPAVHTGKQGDAVTVGGMEFLYIPGGTFSMGSNVKKDESPVHTVRVSPFWMSRYEVTQSQYKKIMGKNPSSYKGFFGGLFTGSYPVEMVSWDHAMEFCVRFGQKHGVVACLPSEAQWEYACRAGTSTRYFWGDEWDGRYSWNFRNSGKKVHPVGKKLPNPWGLYDMAGNVSEWCLDWYSQHYYGKSPELDPRGPDRGFGYVVRGGTWGDGDEWERSAARNHCGGGSYTRGFRIIIIPR